MVRPYWIVVVLLGLTGCGQPLQINPTTASRPTRPAVQVSPSVSDATGSATASAVPDGVASQLPVQTELPPTAASPTSELDATPTAAASPMPAPAEPTSDVVVIPQPPASQNNQERWRAQQVDRQVLPQAQTYIAKNPVPLLWYDPAIGQSVEIGTLIGEFTVQARFSLRGTNRPALEVPYQINKSYGLTSISDAVRGRMQAAGYAESVEAYAFETEDVVPK